MDASAWLASTTFYFYYISLVNTFVLPFDLERERFSMTGVHDILVSTFVLPFDLERGRFSMTGVHDILLLLHLSFISKASPYRFGYDYC